MRLSHPRGTFVSEWFASLRASGARVSLAQWIESLPAEIRNEQVVQPRGTSKMRFDVKKRLMTIAPAES